MEDTTLPPPTPVANQEKEPCPGGLLLEKERKPPSHHPPSQSCYLTCEHFLKAVGSKITTEAKSGSPSSLEGEALGVQAGGTAASPILRKDEGLGPFAVTSGVTAAAAE